MYRFFYSFVKKPTLHVKQNNTKLHNTLALMNCQYAYKINNTYRKLKSYAKLLHVELNGDHMHTCVFFYGFFFLFVFDAVAKAQLGPDAVYIITMPREW